MVMQLQLPNKQKATLISAYAPANTNPEEVKDQFYEQLDALTAAAPKSEKRNHHPWRLKFPRRNRLSHVVRSYWPTRYRQVKQQWPPTPTDLYCQRTRHP